LHLKILFMSEKDSIWVSYGFISGRCFHIFALLLVSKCQGWETWKMSPGWALRDWHLRTAALPLLHSVDHKLLTPLLLPYLSNQISFSSAVCPYKALLLSFSLLTSFLVFIDLPWVIVPLRKTYGASVSLSDRQSVCVCLCDSYLELPLSSFFSDTTLSKLAA